jgi:hypothetical protein
MKLIRLIKSLYAKWKFNRAIKKAKDPFIYK